MKDIHIELIRGHGFYSDRLDNFSICEDVLEELFYITKKNITLVISDKDDRYSHKVRLLHTEPITAYYVTYVEFLNMCNKNEYLLNQTTRCIKQHHEELLTKSFYISILQ